MAEQNESYFETEIQWVSERKGRLQAKGLPSIAVDAPPEFKGKGQGWSPEHLLVGSVNSCLMLTFLAIAENSKLDLVSFSSAAAGKLEKVEGAGYQITEIVIKPKIVVASPQVTARVPRMLEKAKENCFVSNSIKSSLKVEAEIQHQEKQS